MRKIFCVCAVFLVTIAFVFTAGCGQKTEINIYELADKLNGDARFDEQLTNIDLDIAEQVYNISESDVKEAVVFMGTGATVDEISVWRATDAEALKRVNEMVLSRIDEQKESYASYKPEEVPKLDNAVLIQNGLVVVLCVSPDAENAKSIINHFIK